jgi:hypothetical protein
VKIKISQNAVKFVSSSSPREVRTMAARGLIPLAPRDLIKILYILCHDKDEGVQRLADETIRSYSPKIVDSILSGDIEPPIIDYLVRHHREGHLFVGKALANKNTSDETLIYLASGANGTVLDDLSLKHERLLKSPEVLEALIQNPAVKGALRQAMLELADPTARERMTAIPGDTATREQVQATTTPDIDGKSTALTSDNQDDIDGHNIAAQIHLMSVSEKIKYATRGNKEVRAILIKDSSKLVVAAVIKSPKISEEEILKVAQNKQANDEAIRIITLNKEWLKNYSIRVALINNPKTPPGIAMRLIPYLSKKDLKDLAGSRNVSSLISTSAKKALAAKSKTT